MHNSHFAVRWFLVSNGKFVQTGKFFPLFYRFQEQHFLPSHPQTNPKLDFGIFFGNIPSNFSPIFSIFTKNRCQGAQFRIPQKSFPDGFIPKPPSNKIAHRTTNPLWNGAKFGLSSTKIASSKMRKLFFGRNGSKFPKAPSKRRNFWIV